MNKESKLEACTILAQEYSDIAKNSGFDHEEVFNTYMDRCMGRDNEVVAEQVMREAFQKTKADPQLSWVKEWQKEREARKVVEKKYNMLTTRIKEEARKEKDGKDYLTNYAVNGMGFL